MKIDIELPRPAEASVSISHNKQAPHDATISLFPKFFKQRSRGHLAYITVYDANDQIVRQYMLTISGISGIPTIIPLAEVECKFDIRRKAETKSDKTGAS